MSLRKFNAFLHKVSTPLNIINIVVGLLVGIAHVYIPLTSIFGLLLCILMATSSSVSIGLNYYFTSQNTAENATTLQNNNRDGAILKREHTRKSNLFLGFVIPMILLNSAASFFGMYTGTLLLAASLAMPVAPAVVLGLAITLSTVLAVGTLINSWLQAHNVWERLKKPVQQAVAAPQEQLEVRPGNAKKRGIELAPIPSFRPRPQASSTQCSEALFSKTVQPKAEVMEQKKIAAPHHRRTKSL